MAAKIKNPADAATVIVVRDAPKGPEVYLAGRNFSAGAFAGAHVFPGGMVDPADSDPGLARFSVMPDTKGLSGFLGRAQDQREKVIGLFLCALRETFEETGVLFASGLNGRINGELSDYREKIHKNAVNLKHMAQNESLSFRLDRLFPYARWITPENAPKRFDTRFFLARIPKGQKAMPDGQELISGMWIRPEKALDMYRAGGMSLLPPTLMILLSLCGRVDIGDFAGLERQTDIRPVLPQAFSHNNETGILLPHDPYYSVDGYKQPQRPGEPSRVVMVNGRWVPMPKRGEH